MKLVPLTVSLSIMTIGSAFFLLNYRGGMAAADSNSVGVIITNAFEQAINQPAVPNICVAINTQLNPLVPDLVTDWSADLNEKCWMDLSVTLSPAFDPQTFASHVGNARINGQQVTWSLPQQTRFSLQIPYQKWFYGAQNNACVMVNCQN